MQDFQFWTIVGGLLALGVSNFAFLWKISSDNRKADAVRHKEVQGFMNDLRREMNEMYLDLSQRLARLEGRQKETLPYDLWRSPYPQLMYTKKPLPSLVTLPGGKSKKNNLTI